jgi:hypothetical protein
MSKLHCYLLFVIYYGCKKYIIFKIFIYNCLLILLKLIYINTQNTNIFNNNKSANETYFFLIIFSITCATLIHVLSVGVVIILAAWN